MDGTWCVATDHIMRVAPVIQPALKHVQFCHDERNTQKYRRSLESVKDIDQKILQARVHWTRETKIFLLPLLFSRKKYDKSKNTEIVLWYFARVLYKLYTSHIFYVLYALHFDFFLLIFYIQENPLLTLTFSDIIPPGSEAMHPI